LTGSTPARYPAGVVQFIPSAVVARCRLNRGRPGSHPAKAAMLQVYSRTPPFT